MPVYNDTFSPDIDTANVLPPPPKRPRLSLVEPAAKSASIQCNGSHDAFEALHEPKLTRAKVDYWRWKYGEVSQSAAALMPPGLLSSGPITEGLFSSRTPVMWKPQLGADWELALEINMEMGLVPRGRRGTGNTRSDQEAHYALLPPLTAEKCPGSSTFQHSTPPFEVECVSDQKSLEAVRDNIHDLGESLQRKAREQLDLIEMPPPEKGSQPFLEG